MSETEYRLEAFATATLVAGGTGNQINIGPTLPGERWHITLFAASGTLRSRLQIMRGNTFTVSRQLDVTDRADGDTSVTDWTLQGNEKISFWWTRGTVGAVMTCSIQGSRFVPGRRAY